MKRIFIFLAAFTLCLATQAQDRDKYEGLKKISPDRSFKGSANVFHFPDHDVIINLDELTLEDLDIDLSGLESLKCLESLHELSELSSLAELEKLEELESLGELEILADPEFISDIVIISLEEGLKSLETLRDLEIRPRAEQ